MRNMKGWYVGVLGLMLSLASAEALAWGWPPANSANNAAVASAVCDNAHFEKDRAAFAAGSQRAATLETVCGTVVHVYGKRYTRSGWHGYFLLQLDDHSTIRIVSDLGRMNAPAWPWVAEGDKVSARGRYYYDNPHRQGIDWTHHGTSRNWSTAGYVIVNGQKYE